MRIVIKGCFKDRRQRALDVVEKRVDKQTMSSKCTPVYPKTQMVTHGRRRILKEMRSDCETKKREKMILWSLPISLIMY